MVLNWLNVYEQNVFDITEQHLSLLSFVFIAIIYARWKINESWLEMSSDLIGVMSSIILRGVSFVSLILILILSLILSLSCWEGSSRCCRMFVTKSSRGGPVAASSTLSARLSTTDHERSHRTPSSGPIYYFIFLVLVSAQLLVFDRLHRFCQKRPLAEDLARALCTSRLTIHRSYIASTFFWRRGT